MSERKNARKPCAIDQCDKLAVARGWCATHYSRWKRTGDVNAEVPTERVRLGPPECVLCGAQSVGRGYCRKHYSRWRNHGDPTVVLPPGGLDRGGECSIEGCGKEHLAKGYCKKHYRRWKKYGDPVGRPPEGHREKQTVGYAGAHGRVRRKRGKASSHLCVDCGAVADDWSYIGGDPDELVAEYGGRLLAYSLDIKRYAPRCSKCHIAFDKVGD